jgi:hypothetical protein
LPHRAFACGQKKRDQGSNIISQTKSTLDRNWQVSFHKPTMKAVDGKVSHAQSRAGSAA